MASLLLSHDSNLLQSLPGRLVLLAQISASPFHENNESAIAELVFLFKSVLSVLNGLFSNWLWIVHKSYINAIVCVISNVKF